MTDDLDRLRDELRGAKPSAEVKTRGIDAAMAAFDDEFSGETQKSTQAVQGSDSARRLTGQTTPRGREKPRRRSMLSRIPTINQMMGGSAIAAVLAAFVVVPNIKDELETPYTNVASGLETSNTEKRERADSNAPIAEESFAAEPEAKVAVPGETPAITSKVIDAPASVSRLSVPGKTAQVQARAAADESDADDRSVAAKAAPVDGATVPASPPPPPVVAISPAPSQPAAQFGASAPQALERQAPLGDAVAGLAAPSEDREMRVIPQSRRTVTETIVVGTAADGTLQTRTTMRNVPPAAVDVLPNTYQAEGRDRFEAVEDFPTKRTTDEPVSTFSVDVDTASYSFMRASLNRGQLPDPASVRLEELINYFPYDYAAPDSAQEPFKAGVTVTPTPWNADTKLMHIGIKGYAPTVAERPNSNIVLLIDTSGSMNNPNKLPLLINSFKLLLDTLGEDDTVSIVTYAGSAGTVLEPTPASNRAEIIAAFDRLRAGGSTAGAAGLKLAYAKAQESFDADGINRVILATDGDFNVGFRSPEEMKTFVERKRESGVFLSVLGFGKGNYNDHLMQTLAQNGNGVAAYIDTLSEARKVLADEAGGALIPIAKDVKIQVEFNPGQISEYRLIGYETRALNREDFNNDKVDAGEIGSGHTVTAIYEITPKGSPAELVDDLRYGDAEAEMVSQDDSDEYAFVKIRYKLPNEDTSTLITRPVGALDEAETLGAADQETRFAASVAAFGQMLRGGSRIGDFSYDDVIALANGAKGEDAFGYRAEFVTLVRLAKSLDRND